MMKSSKFGILSVIALAAVGSVSCKGKTLPVQFNVGVTDKNTVEFNSTLNDKYGINFGAEIPVLEYGSVYVRGESENKGLQFGVDLKTSSFIPEAWVGYEEVSTLPTGASFPSWLTTPVVELSIPPINSSKVSWKVYVGIRGQWYVGAAALLNAVDANFPQVNINYNFYDKQDRLIVGLQFFPAKVRANGEVEVNGGFFAGTNLTPFISKTKNENVSFTSSEISSLVEAAQAGKGTQFRGVSVEGRISAKGMNTRTLRGKAKLSRLMKRYVKALNSSN